MTERWTLPRTPAPDGGRKSAEKGRTSLVAHFSTLGGETKRACAAPGEIER
jgi:hypothetical protein